MSKRVFFEADATTSNEGLWVSDGTAAGTYEVGGADSAGIANAYSKFDPINLAAFSDGVLFRAIDNTGGNGLWFSDGTAAGTYEIGGPKNAGVSGAYGGVGLQPFGILSFGSKALFFGLDTSDSNSLWATDGTAAGTIELGGIKNSGISGAYALGFTPQSFAVFGNKVLFSALDTDNYRGLWITDGTTAGTFEIGGLNNAGVAGVGPAGLSLLAGIANPFTPIGSKALFIGNDADSFPSLWVTDGTSSGTLELGGLKNAGITGASHTAFSPSDVTAIGTNALFAAFDNGTIPDKGLWITDGTMAGTSEIGGVGDAGVGSVAQLGLQPTNITAFGNNKAVFLGYDSSASLFQQLWVTDGTATGTTEIGGIQNGGIAGKGPNGLKPTLMTSIGAKVVFEATDASGLSTLWVTDGTQSGTFEIGGVNNAGVTGAPSGGLRTFNLVANGSTADFVAVDETTGANLGLWVTDGTVAGTHAVANVAGALNPGVSDALGIVSTNAPPQLDYFIASESKTGDYYLGYVVDSQGKYSTGSGFTSTTTDQAGGNWTYYVYNTGPSSGVSPALNGYVYDTGYWDASAKTGYAPYYSVAGTNFLGTDVDFINVNGTFLEYGGGNYVVPDVKIDYFVASESKTGDYYLGYVIDDQGKYSTGSGFTSNTTDQAGGNWTYYVYNTASTTANNASLNGYVYDTGYWDASAKTGYAPYYSVAGTSFLGTDVDYITVNGAVLEYGGGKYVVPDVKIDYFIASESKTGDYYLGYVIDDQGKYSTGSGFTSNTTDQAGGNWTYYVYNSVSTTANNASLNGYVYDTGYWDADVATGYAPYYAVAGVNFLGTDVDWIAQNGSLKEYGGGNFVVGGASAKSVASSSSDQAGAIAQTTIAAGTTQEISSAYSGAISFAGSTGTLQLDNSSSFSGTVAGLAGQDTLDLRDINPAAVQTPTYSGNSTGGTLTVTDGTHSANIALLGNYIASTFVSSSDGHGGTSIVNSPIASQNGLLAPANHA